MRSGFESRFFLKSLLQTRAYDKGPAHLQSEPLGHSFAPYSRLQTVHGVNRIGVSVFLDSIFVFAFQRIDTFRTKGGKANQLATLNQCVVKSAAITGHIILYG